MTRIGAGVVTLVIFALTAGYASAQEGGLDLPARTDAHSAAVRGLAYLQAAQDPSGGWEAVGKPHLGVSALVAKCFAQQAEYGPNHPVTKRAMAFVLKHVQPDGGVYVPDEGLRNYSTSVALMALSSTKDPASTRRSMRSRTKSLPCCFSLSWYRAGPPDLA